VPAWQAGLQQQAVLLLLLLLLAVMMRACSWLQEVRGMFVAGRV
jgi:hypothetical protein